MPQAGFEPGSFEWASTWIWNWCSKPLGHDGRLWVIFTTVVGKLKCHFSTLYFILLRSGLVVKTFRETKKIDSTMIDKQIEEERCWKRHPPVIKLKGKLHLKSPFMICQLQRKRNLTGKLFYLFFTLFNWKQKSW